MRGQEGGRFALGLQDSEVIEPHEGSGGCLDREVRRAEVGDRTP